MGEVADMATSAMTKTAAGAPRHPLLLPEAGPVCPSASCPPAPRCLCVHWACGGPGAPLAGRGGAANACSRGSRARSRREKMLQTKNRVLTP